MLRHPHFLENTIKLNNMSKMGRLFLEMQIREQEQEQSHSMADQMFLDEAVDLLNKVAITKADETISSLDNSQFGVMQPVPNLSQYL